MISLEDLKKRFEKFDERSAPRIRDIPSDFKKASVLIPLFWKDEEWRILLTERTMHLRSHAGNVAFPGGRQDEEDADEIAAALREAEEEVGLRPEDVQIIALLPASYVTHKNIVTPVLAVISSDFIPKLNEQEVEKVFDLPLSRFLKSDFSIHRMLFHGKTICVYSFADICDGETVVTWGFTAMYCMLVALIAHHANNKMEFVEGVLITKENAFEDRSNFLQVIINEQKTCQNMTTF